MWGEMYIQNKIIRSKKSTYSSTMTNIHKTTNLIFTFHFALLDVPDEIQLKTTIPYINLVLMVQYYPIYHNHSITTAHNTNVPYVKTPPQQEHLTAHVN